MQERPRVDIQRKLRRTDKWYLGGGKAVIWAPEFPLWLERPGFWDHACFLDCAVQPLFTVTMLDEQDREIPLKFCDREWVPSHLTQRYEPTEGLEFAERRALLPDDVLTSVISVRNTTDRKRRLGFVVWTIQEQHGDVPSKSFMKDIAVEDEVLRFTRRNNDKEGAARNRFALAFGASHPLQSSSINITDGGVVQPRWDITPFRETISEGRLPNDAKIAGGINPDGQTYMALQYTVEIEPHGEASFAAFCAIAKDMGTATGSLSAAMSLADPIATSIGNWNAFFDSVPYFECSDPYIDRYYWYRWYGIRLNTVSIREFPLNHPCVYEGTNAGWFRHNISYSAQCHMYECRWLHDPSTAQGSLLNFTETQAPDGAFFGGIWTHIGFDPKTSSRGGEFYHADWGRGVREVYRVHPDDDFLRRVYEPLVKYAEYFDRERDREGSNLYDVVGQGETGQEFMSRYLFVDPKADHWGRIQLKGIDASSYIYELKSNLAWMAEKLGNGDAERWRKEAEEIREAVRGKMWDPKTGFFFDCDPKTLARSPYKAAVCFYPFMSDLAGEEHLRAITEHLLYPEEFWTPWPVPSTSVDDPYFSAEGEWKDKRHHCPWNGRSWLMTNSHVAEALACAAENLDPSLREKAAELISKTIRMTFLDGDVNRPTSYEYYNPITGQAPLFRGVDDYMHSWIVDLIIRFVAGIRPRDGSVVTVDPFPFDLDSFSISDVRVKGHSLSVNYDRKAGMRVMVDGRLVEERKSIGRVDLDLSA